jgi:hypothetical protein
MPEELSTHVGLATLALLCYRLLFCSNRELSLTALLFCAACAWCAAQLAAAATGTGVPLAPLTPPAAGAAGAAAGAAGAAATAAAAAAAAARSLCSSVLFSSTVREACWNYTAYFAPEEPAP